MDGIAIQAGMTRQAAAAPALDPLTEDFAARLLVKGYTLDGARLSAYDAFIVAGQTNGWLAHMIEMHPFEGSDITDTTVKLIYRGGDPSDLTVTGYTTADIQPGGGIYNASATKRYQTINANTLTNVHGMGWWSRNATFSTLSPIALGFSNASTPYLGMSNVYATNSGTLYIQGYYNIWGGGGNTVGGGVAPVRGLTRLHRTGLSYMEARVNDKSLGTNTATIADTRRNGAINLAEASYEWDFSFIDDGAMSAGEATALLSDLTTLMTALGRDPRTPDTLLGLLIGQSLANASQGNPALTVAPVASYDNRMLSFAGSNMLGFARSFNQSKEYIYAEAMNTISKLRRDAVPGDGSRDLTFATRVLDGAHYDLLKKGSTVYNNSIADITAAKAHHDALYGGDFSMACIFAVHGESDITNANYDTAITQWQIDYETDIKAITGQSGTIPMLHSQPSSWTKNIPAATSVAPYKILQVSVADPTKTILVCPKYFLTHAADGVHLTNTSYRILAGYYGKAQHAVFNTGTYTPLRPTSVTRSGAVITLSFVGRVGSLVLDTTAVSDPGNYGFEWAQTGGTAQTIASVALINSDTQVEITLTGDPGSPSAELVGYAFTGVSGNNGGPTDGARGCLRDSDTTANYSGTALPNWCVHWQYPVGYADP